MTGAAAGPSGDSLLRAPAGVEDEVGRALQRTVQRRAESDAGVRGRVESVTGYDLSDATVHKLVRGNAITMLHLDHLK